MPSRKQSITRRTYAIRDRRVRAVIDSVKILGVGLDSRAQTIEIEVRIARLHRIPRPLDQLAAFAERTFSLRPLQTRAHAFVLVVLRHRHHVRVAEDLLPAHRGEMMQEAHHALARESAERPAASLA